MILTALGPTVIAVMWVETVIAFIFTALRLYTRKKLVNNIGWDDHLAAASMVLFILYSIFVTASAVNGLGSHLSELTIEQFAKAVKLEIIGQSCNIVAIATSKSSVAVFLMRILVNKWHFAFLWFCIASTVFVCISCIILMFTQCSPVEGIFNPTIPKVCYFNFTADAIFSGSYTAAMDFVLAIFPWFVLWNLNMKRKERLTIAFGLSLGVFAGICGIVRAIELRGLSAKSDYLYETVPLILWGSTELLVCLFCATVPALRPLYKHVRGKGSSSDPYQSGGQPYASGSKGTKVESGYHLSRLSRSLGGKNNGVSESTVTYGCGRTGNTSDESILRETRQTQGEVQGIKMTTEVNVSSSY